MKTQAWGWLAAAVMAAGVNANYHDGGMQWAHEFADRVQHNSEAVLALATGRTDQFLAQAQMVAAKHETSTSCPFAAALAKAERASDRAERQIDRAQARMEMRSGEFEVMSAREQAALARLAANRARMEIRLANMRIPERMSAVVIPNPQVSCPRVRVNIPRLPMIKMPATPTVHLETPGAGPV